MKNIFIIGLLIVFLASQFSYSLASCEICGNPVGNGRIEAMTDIELLQIEQCLEDCFEPFICGAICFVAAAFQEVLNALIGACALTLMYGEQSIEVELLRDYRDNVLSQTPEGREIIKLYYQWSPVIVRAIQEDGAFKQEIKDIVDEIFPMLSR